MKAEELMIGDWVNLTYRSYISGEVVSKDFRVGQIRKYTAEDKDYHLYAERQNMGDVENISPILLTPEILEKNGFKACGYEEFALDIDDFWFALQKGKDGINAWWWEMYYSPIIPINYVHELQHALKLCGIDKTIEL